jgi:mono/diheme cytochrome c family protein
MKRMVCSIALVLVLTGLSANDAATQELPDGVTQAMVDQGKTIFASTGLCAACHGPDAKGLVGPDLTDAEWFSGTGEYTEIVERIKVGVSAAEAKNTMGAIMPARGGSGITDEQVEAVAAYVWTLSHG